MLGRAAKWTIAVACATVVVPGCARNAYVRSTSTATVNPAPPDAVSPGTLVSAQVHQPLATNTARPGDRFSVELLDPLIDGSGREVIGRGAILQGVVANARESKVAGQAAGLQLQIAGVQSPGEGLIPVPMEVAESPVSLSSVWKRELLGSVGGGVVGAGTGLAINHSEAGVVVGSTLVGIGLGALLAYVTGTRDAALPSGSVVTLRVTRPLELPKPIAATPGCPVIPLAKTVRSAATP